MPGGVILCHSLEDARALKELGFRRAEGGTYPHEAPLLTKSALYTLTFRRTLTTRTVRAPRRACGCPFLVLEKLMLFSIEGYPLIHSFRRVGTPSVPNEALLARSRACKSPPKSTVEVAVPGRPVGKSCQRIKARMRCSVALAASRYCVYEP